MRFQVFRKFADNEFQGVAPQISYEYFVPTAAHPQSNYQWKARNGACTKTCGGGQLEPFFFFNTSLSHVVNLGHLPIRLLQLQEQHYPFLSACAAFSCVQTVVIGVAASVLGFLMYTDVNAHNCTLGPYEHCERVCAES